MHLSFSSSSLLPLPQLWTSTLFSSSTNEHRLLLYSSVRTIQHLLSRAHTASGHDAGHVGSPWHPVEGSCTKHCPQDNDGQCSPYGLALTKINCTHMASLLTLNAACRIFDFHRGRLISFLPHSGRLRRNPSYDRLDRLVLSSLRPRCFRHDTSRGGVSLRGQRIGRCS